MTKEKDAQLEQLKKSCTGTAHQISRKEKLF